MDEDLTVNAMKLSHQSDYQRDGTIVKQAVYRFYLGNHGPFVEKFPEDALQPKSVVREMYELGMSFTDFVSRYQLARSEGLVLRYLSDAYRTLRHTVPESHRTPELEELTDWLGETVRQTDSSLLDEWEALADPDHVLERHHELAPASADAAGPTFAILADADDEVVDWVLRQRRPGQSGALFAGGMRAAG